VLAGDTGCASLDFQSSMPLTALSFRVELLALGLSGFVLNPEARFSATMQTNRPQVLDITLQTPQGQPMNGNGKLGSLCFRASSTKSSSFIPLIVSNISAVAVSGEPPGWVHGNAGRVVLIKNTPLIEAVPGETENRVFVYAPPSLRVTVQWAPN